MNATGKTKKRRAVSKEELGGLRKLSLATPLLLLSKYRRQFIVKLSWPRKDFLERNEITV